MFAPLPQTRYFRGELKKARMFALSLLPRLLVTGASQPVLLSPEGFRFGDIPVPQLVDNLLGRRQKVEPGQARTFEFRFVRLIPVVATSFRGQASANAKGAATTSHSDGLQTAKALCKIGVQARREQTSFAEPAPAESARTLRRVWFLGQLRLHDPTVLMAADISEHRVQFTIQTQDQSDPRRTAMSATAFDKSHTPEEFAFIAQW